jgi:hypothetical protein
VFWVESLDLQEDKSLANTLLLAAAVLAVTVGILQTTAAAAVEVEFYLET